MELSHNSIERIENLGHAEFLSTLDLAHNSIGNIEGLQSLKFLQVLCLNDNDISLIEGLAGLENLGYVGLKGNSIARIENLGDVQVYELDVSGNKISYIGDGLAPSPGRLAVIDLSDNQLSSLEGLEHCTTLKEIKVAGNPLPRVVIAAVEKYNEQSWDMEEGKRATALRDLVTLST